MHRSFADHSKLVKRLKILWSYIERTNCEKSIKHVFFQAPCFILRQGGCLGVLSKP